MWPDIFFFKFIVYLFLTVLGLLCCTDFSLFACRDSCLAVVRGLLIAVASFAAERVGSVLRLLVSRAYAQ